MIVGPTKALFMDEISNGLDSSTTFQIVACLQQLVHITDATVLISLLQPAPETFNLFDDIILMAEGKIVYHGPRCNILGFFENCGFRCPERKGVADFLQEVHALSYFIQLLSELLWLSLRKNNLFNCRLSLGKIKHSTGTALKKITLMPLLMIFHGSLGNQFLGRRLMRSCQSHSLRRREIRVLFHLAHIRFLNGNFLELACQENFFS